MTGPSSARSTGGDRSGAGSIGPGSIRAGSIRAGSNYAGPIYARDRSRERLQRRSLLLFLALWCTVLACRPVDAPAVRPELRPRPAPEPPPERVEVKPIETAALLPATDPPPAPAKEPAPLGPLVLRVGLATDLESVELPCCDGRIKLVAGERELPFDSPIRIRPAAEVSGAAVYRLQVAALKDEKQAEGIAEYLRQSTEHAASAVFDADTDLYRVRVGEFADKQSAEALRGELAGLGVIEGWVVSEGGRLEGAAYDVLYRQESYRVEGRWLEVKAPTGVGIPFGRQRYRGQVLLFLNERGLVNVINELELEDYLRGVVPREMGPELYNRLEALKAQTVAARTYTLRNLGEFSGEGYDICSTPRCQVYGGMNSEHPVSDKAIEQTSGQVVLWDGKPAETFYSATSGGHTENVEVIFPLKRGEYLRGVPCLEAGARLVEGNVARGSEFPAGLVRRLLPPTGKGARALSARLEHLALLADLPAPRDRLGSLQRSEVLRYVVSIFDMALDRRLTSQVRELKRVIDQPPEDWQRRDFRLATFLRSSGYLEGSGRELSAAEVESLLLELALYLGVLREERVHFSKLEGARLEIRRGAQRPEIALPPDFATFRRRGDRLLAGRLDLMAGDRLRLYWRGSDLLALVQPIDSPEVQFGKRAPKRRWTVFKTDSELRQAVQKRYPGFPFATFEVLERGVSGRVGKMALVGDGGERIVVEGLAVRWTLDVWDTLFQAERRRSQSGELGWHFTGRGWGHGVGMSQAGAYGMAVRGLTYREILEHYYTGVGLGRLKPVAWRPRQLDETQAASPRQVAEPRPSAPSR